MAIIKKASDRSAGFVIIDRRAIQDSRLTWGARGLHGYLQSLPGDWEVRVKHLIGQSPDGRDIVYRLFRELIANGYVVRQQIRNANGSIGGTEYLVYELPRTGNPDTVLPHTGEPDSVDRQLQSKQGDKNNKKRTTQPPVDLEADAEMPNFPDSIPKQERTSLVGIISGLEATTQQLLIDEIAAYIEFGELRGSPCALARGLVKAVSEGRFRPSKSRVHKQRDEASRQKDSKAKEAHLSRLSAEIRALEQLIEAAPVGHGSLQVQLEKLKRQHEVFAQELAHANAS